MATAEDILRDMRDFGSLIIKRGGDNPGLADQLVASLAVRISNLKHFTAREAMTLSDGLATSTLTDLKKSIVQKAIDHRTTGTLTSPSKLGHCNQGTPKEQSMRHMNNFLTSGDYLVLDDARASLAKKTNVVCHRLSRLGVRQAGHDGLLKWAMVILLHCEFELTHSWPSYRDIYTMFTDMKECLKTARKPYPHAFIDAYPEHPEKLPEDVYKYAYDSDDPPVPKHIPRYEMMARHVPMRSNSALLAKEAVKTSPSEPVSSHAINQSSVVTWAHMVALVKATTPEPQALQTFVPKPEGSQAFVPKLRMAPTPEPQAILDGPKTANGDEHKTANGDEQKTANGDEQKAADESGRVPQQSYEDAAMLALMGRNAKSKAKALAQAKTKAKAKAEVGAAADACAKAQAKTGKPKAKAEVDSAADAGAKAQAKLGKSKAKAKAKPGKPSSAKAQAKPGEPKAKAEASQAKAQIEAHAKPVKAQVVLKRPMGSCCELFVPYKLTITADDGTKNRNNYQSKCYKKAKLLAERGGLSSTEIKAESSRVLKAAGILWDSKFKRDV